MSVSIANKIVGLSEEGADDVMSVSMAIDTVGLLEVGGDATGNVVTELTDEIDGTNEELEEGPIEGIDEMDGTAVDVIGAGLGPRVVSSCAAINAGASMRCSSVSAAMRGSIIIFIWDSKS